MALDTYANLKAEIENWSHRDDVNNKIDSFIDVCESQMYKTLRIREMEVRATATALTTTRYFALPSGFLEMSKLEIEDGSKLREVYSSSVAGLRPISSIGMPRYFAITSQIEFDRKPDSAYTLQMLYFKKLTALSSSNTTNDILTNHPAIYLYGSLWALYKWANNAQEEARYSSLFNEAIDDANRTSERGKYGAAPVMRTEGSTP